MLFLGISTSVATIVAAIFTGYAAFQARTSAMSAKSQVDHQIRQYEENKTPKLIPVFTDFSTTVYGIFNDWFEVTSEVDEYKYPTLEKKFSSFSLPLINFGNSPAINIQVEHYLKGGSATIQLYNSEVPEEKFNSLPFSSRHRLTEIKNREEGTTKFFSINIQGTNIYGQEKERICKINAISTRIPYTDTKKTLSLPLPDYFILLNNIYLNQWYLKVKRTDIVLPTLVTKIIYFDTDHKRYEGEFEFYIKRNPIKSKNGVITSSIEFNIIKNGPSLTREQ